MGYEKKFKEYENVSEYTPKETKAEVDKYPIKAIPERGISKATCELLGIRSGVSEEDGTTVVAYYFPYHDQKGNVVGYKKRDLTKDKAERGHFSAIGTVSVTCKLFGQQYAESVQRKRTNLIYVEGELDVASALEAMIGSVKGTKFETLRPFVVGLSCGTANAVEATLHNEHFIRSFDKITLGMDADEATPAEKRKGIKRGKEAMEDIAGAIIGDNLYVVQYDGNYKDPSDYLQEGDGAALAKLLQFGSKRFITEKIAYASDVSFEELIEKRKEGLMCPSFPKLMEKIKGFRKSELVLLTSGVGVGKSTVTSSFAADFIAAGERVGLIFLEETKRETLQRMVAHALKVNYNKFKADPLSVASEQEIKAAYDNIVEDDKAVFLDHFGHLPISELMNKIKHMHLVSKCSYIILDHITLVSSGGGDDVDERKQIDHCMTELAAFCASNEVCIIAISHINRGGFLDNKPPKDADEKPYWVKVDKSHMRGSSALEALSWIILGLEGQVMPDRSRGNVRLTVLKNRPYGMLGVCDEFKLNPETWVVELQDVEGF